MADMQVLDTSDVVVPYEAVGWDLPLSGPTEVPFTIPAFGVRRLHIVVPPGLYACYETFAQGDHLVSWREGGLGESGTWDEVGPTEMKGETILMVTAVAEGAQFTLDILDVDDDPDCGDESEEEECDLSLICSPSGYFFRIDLLAGSFRVFAWPVKYIDSGEYSFVVGPDRVVRMTNNPAYTDRTGPTCVSDVEWTADLRGRH